MDKIREFTQDLIDEIQDSDWVDVIKLAFLFSFTFLMGTVLAVLFGLFFIVLPWCLHPLLGLFTTCVLVFPFVFVVSIKFFLKKESEESNKCKH